MNVHQMGAAQDAKRLPLAYNQKYRIERSARSDGSFAPTLRPVVGAMTVTGPLDIGMLKTAMRWVIEHHSSLRVFYYQHGGGVWQGLLPSETVAAWLDTWLRPRPGDWEADVRETVQQPFDLGSGPLFRVGLHRTGDDEHVLWVVFDHSIIDGFGVQLFTSALAEAYDRLIRGEDPTESLEATDYEQWAHRVGGDLWADEHAYWASFLKNRDPHALWQKTLPLPPSGPARSRSVDIRFSGAESAMIQSRFQSIPLGLSSLFIAAVGTVLGEWIGVSEIPLYVPMANRVALGHAALIANVASELPIFVDTAKSPSLVQLISAIRDELLEILNYQFIPISEIFKILNAQADMRPASARWISGGDIPRVIVNMTRSVTQVVSAPDGVRFTGRGVELGGQSQGWVSGLFITLKIGHDDQSMSGSLFYDPARIDEMTVRRIAGSLHDTLLRACATAAAG